MGAGASVGEPVQIQVKIWRKPVVEDGQHEVQFVYPEEEEELLNNKESVGLALSGGGMRSATSSLGWLQALNKLKLFSNFKYLSSISGGSWSATPLTFSSTVDIDTFLSGGEPISPSDSTIERLTSLSSLEGSHASVLANSNLVPSLMLNLAENFPTTLLDVVTGNHIHDQIDFWSEAIGNNFFKPHAIECANNSR